MPVPKGQTGESGVGLPFDPRQLVDPSTHSTPEGGAPRPSPGPNVPIPAAEFDRLKEQARYVRASRVKRKSR